MEKWKFCINWRTKKKEKGNGGRLPGVYTFSEAKKLSKYLRKNNPDNLYWIATLPSFPISKRDKGDDSHRERFEK